MTTSCFACFEIITQSATQHRFQVKKFACYKSSSILGALQLAR